MTTNITISVNPNSLKEFDEARGPMHRSTLINLLMERETEAIKERGGLI